MATGRTLSRWSRVYGNGYDLSGYTRSLGTLPWEFESGDISAMTEEINNYLIGRATIGPVTLNGVFDSTATSGLHVLASGVNTSWDLMIALGIRAAPAMGDPVYCGKFTQKGYQAQEDNVAMVATVPFGLWDGGDLLHYEQPWGTLVHPLGVEDAVNADAGYDDGIGAGAPSELGGYMMYQVTAHTGVGNAIISIDDSANNIAWAALGDATVSVEDTDIPCAGIVEIDKDAEVRQYIRWQLSLAGMTDITFALAFVRGR
jgi:hypothetical protein